MQSTVCVVAIQSCKTAGIITYRDFKTDEAKKCETLTRGSDEKQANFYRVSRLAATHRHDLHRH